MSESGESKPSLESPPQIDAMVREWWVSLQDRRGDRAELRRCRTPDAVAFVPAYHRLRIQLRGAGVSVPGERLAVIAGVLSHVETDDRAGTFAEGMAGSENGKARVSGLRFRRLLAIDELPELYAALVRMVHLLDRTASVRDLVRAIRWWNDRTKKQWAFDYYAKAPNED